MLALRGVHPDVRPPRRRWSRSRARHARSARGGDSLRTWVHSVLPAAGLRRLHVAVRRQEPPRARSARSRRCSAFPLGVGIWLTTWVLPVTFMVAMAWGCETHARQLGRRTLLYYDGEATSILDAIKVADRDKTAATTNARSSVPSSCSSRSPFRSGSSRTSITSGKRSGSIGWARSARSWRSRW